MAVAKSNGNNQNRKIKVQNQKRTLWGVSSKQKYTIFSGVFLFWHDFVLFYNFMHNLGSNLFFVNFGLYQKT